MDIYLIFVFILFALAIFDLIVGVSNDAVNFLNSAIGSKVAPRNVIMIIASLGILFGAVFSNGMMEVARKGIFHPQYFMFTEIMVIFLAVMITDILLLDFFNTIGLPTSTTVSIVFEILGAAVAVAFLKVKAGAHTIMVDGAEKVAVVSDYINSDKAMTIIGGILLSVVVAFTVGLIVQGITRIAFSFNYKRPIKYFGAIWGGFAIAAITYFILIKGVKGAAFMDSDTKTLIKENWLLISVASFVAWTVLLQLLNWIFKINILKVIVLVGTFALAMAFAGNDLVNFIGVPLAGFEAFNLADGNDILMNGLAKKVQTPSYFLVIAGLIMVLTLWFSKKARSVTETELNLSRQDEGEERFNASIFARLLVRRAITTGTFFSTVIPEPIVLKLKKRFDQKEIEKQWKKEENPPMFDLIRASVNLTVASILISLATSYKLPLSTTYVTFMVAMGTSLADGAWGRDSAVYRITGVFTVIGGWFMTALTAFTVAFLVALFISWAHFVGVIILVIFAAFAIIRSTRSHKRKQQEKAQMIEDDSDVISNAEAAVVKCNKGVTGILGRASGIYYAAVQGLIDENRKDLKEQYDLSIKLNEKTKKQKNNLYKVIAKLQQDSIETGHYYVQVLDYQREMAHSINFLVKPIYEHVENNHKALAQVQIDELLELSYGINEFTNIALRVVNEGNFILLDDVHKKQSNIIELLNTYRKLQIKRIKNKEVGTKNSMLYLSVLNETRNLVLNAVNVVKAQRDFIQYTSSK